MVEIITRGNMMEKQETSTRAMVNPIQPKAQPFCLRWMKYPTSRSATNEATGRAPKAMLMGQEVGVEERGDQQVERRIPRRQPKLAGSRVGAFHQFAAGLQAQEDGPVQGEPGYSGKSTNQAVGIEQGPESAGIDPIRIDRDTFRQVGKDYAHQQCREQAAGKYGPIPGAAPLRVRIFAAKLKRDAARNQRQQEQEHRQIKAAEHASVPVREGGKSRAAGSHQPDFVAVPVRADGVDDGPAFGVIFSQEGQEHPDPEVEALQEEKPDVEYGNQDEPEDIRGPSLTSCAYSMRSRQRTRTGFGHFSSADRCPRPSG